MRKVVPIGIQYGYIGRWLIAGRREVSRAMYSGGAGSQARSRQPASSFEAIR